jgi:hypothetical protein
VLKTTDISEEGKRYQITVKEFFNYCRDQRDEDPLYVFDYQFGERVPELHADYDVCLAFSVHVCVHVCLLFCVKVHVHVYNILYVRVYVAVCVCVCAFIFCV